MTDNLPDARDIRQRALRITQSWLLMRQEHEVQFCQSRRTAVLDFGLTPSAEVTGKAMAGGDDAGLAV